MRSVSGSHFDAIADQYDESLPAHVVEHYLRKRTSFIQAHVRPGARVLDVGCGTGTLAARVREAGFQVAGVEPSAGMLDVLRQRAPGIEAVRGSGSAVPFGDGQFDLAYSVAVMHHIAHPDLVRRTVVEMVRVVRRGGLVLIWDHNPRNPYWKLLMARVPQDTGEERLVPEEEFLSALSTAGAELVCARQLGFVPDFVPPALIGLAARAERAVEAIPGLRRLCAHNVILARKL
jgi:ubiquinone/menaquinone biosynthesis C-methylase UbiE